MSNEENTEVTNITNCIARIKKAAQASKLKHLEDEEIVMGVWGDGQSPVDPLGENYPIITNDDSGNHIAASPKGWLKEKLKAQKLAT